MEILLKLEKPSGRVSLVITMTKYTPKFKTFEVLYPDLVKDNSQCQHHNYSVILLCHSSIQSPHNNGQSIKFVVLQERLINYFPRCLLHDMKA